MPDAAASKTSPAPAVVPPHLTDYNATFVWPLQHEDPLSTLYIDLEYLKEDMQPKPSGKKKKGRPVKNTSAKKTSEPAR